jgi:CRP/FNR family transcriptional regulator, cyclic AMP receptor protein
MMAGMTLESDRMVRLLMEDPDLGADLSPDEQVRAAERVVAPLLSMSVGHESALSQPVSHQGLIGFLVLEGLMLREIEVAGTSAAELIGAGDLIHPGDIRASDLSPLNGRLRWTLLAPARLAILDGGFCARVGEWPQILGRLAVRAVGRIHGLAVNRAISHQGRIEDRLLLLFWDLAQRWGRVSTEGVLLELPLTHMTLAKLVSAQRPSVTNALGVLRRRGLLFRRADRFWLLPLPIPQELESLLARRTVVSEPRRQVRGSSEVIH